MTDSAGGRGSQLTLVNVISRKGGTGKTTLGLLLATHLGGDTSQARHSVMLDLDISGTQLIEGLLDLLGDEEPGEEGPKDGLTAFLFDPPWTHDCDRLTASLLPLPALGRVSIAVSQTRREEIWKYLPVLEWEHDTRHLCHRFEEWLFRLMWDPPWDGAKHITVFFDNGPGEIGLASALASHQWSGLARRLRRFCECRVGNLYVCTSDLPDLRAAVRWLDPLASVGTPTQVVLNRVHGAGELEAAQLILGDHKARPFRFDKRLLDLYSGRVGAKDVVAALQKDEQLSDLVAWIEELPTVSLGQ